MDNNRREFIVVILSPGVAFVIGCEALGPRSPASPGPNPPTPSPESTTLISKVLLQANSAARAPFGTNGAARIAIRGDINWNFDVDGRLVAIDTNDSPTVDVANIVVPNNANVIIRSF